MIAAASALPLMVIVQLFPSMPWLVRDIQLPWQVIYLDRATFVLALCAYGAWLIHSSKAPDWAARVLLVTVGAGLFAVSIPDRIIAIPLIWTLQASIFAALAAWCVSVWRHCMLSRAHLLAACAFHGIGTAMFYPVCQIGRGGLYIPPDNFRLACDAVIGPYLTGGLFAAAAITWVGLLAVPAVAKWR